MARASAIAASPFVALCLVGTKLWAAISLTAGVGLSLAVCGLLYLFVDCGMTHLVSGLRGRGKTDVGSQTLQFMLVLFTKFLVLGGVGYAVLTFHAINLLAVLLGFIVAQAAIILTAIRHWTPRRPQQNLRTKN